MKIILRGTVAAIALAATAGAAQAQATHKTTNVNEYASSAAINGTNPTTYNATTPAQVTAAEAVFAQGATDPKTTVPLGTRFSATTTASDDTEAASPTVATAFKLKGEVNKDCSFYAGNTAAASTIDFGTIGVRTGNNENVGAAFEMAGPLKATIQTRTAGCNFNNEVKIEKLNQFGGGLQLAGNPGGFDVKQFQTNIPYEVKASWEGVALDSISEGTAQSLTVAANSSSGTKQQGAWRSQMTIDIDAPAINFRGLVAGKYEDTLTVTLRAL